MDRKIPGIFSPFFHSSRSWLSETQWAQLKTLENMEAFKKGGQLTQNIEQDICWMQHDETSIVHDGNNHGKPIKKRV